MYGRETATCTVDGAKLLQVGRGNRDRAGEIIDGKVTILSLLGEGGMGGVYRALQHSMQREVAVKILHRSFSNDMSAVKRFLQEATTASKLNHPNIITLFDFGQSEHGELYLMMELLEGVPLSEALDSAGPFPPAKAVEIVAQVCEAVHHAHEQGLIHRDLKPDNIFVIRARRRDFVKVLDFGIAKMKTVEAASQITRTGMVCGTPAYMAPEQAMGEEVDRRSDIYSIGVILYELLIGVRPFDHDTPLKLLLAHASEPPKTMRELRPEIPVPAVLERVVMRTLSKEPGARPATAAALADELLAAMESADKKPATESLVPLNADAEPAPKADLGTADTALAMVTPVGLPNTGSHATTEDLDALETGTVPSTARTAEVAPTGDARGGIPIWAWGAAAAWVVVGIGLWIAFGSTEKTPKPEPTTPQTPTLVAEPAERKPVPAEKAVAEPVTPEPVWEPPKPAAAPQPVVSVAEPRQVRASDPTTTSQKRRPLVLVATAPAAPRKIKRPPKRVVRQPRKTGKRPEKAPAKTVAAPPPKPPPPKPDKPAQPDKPRPTGAGIIE